MKRVLWAVAVLFVVGLCALGWLVVVYPNRVPAGGPRRTVGVELDQHSTVASVARDLERAGLIERASVYALYARVMGAEHRLRRGTILVTTQMTARELLQRLAQGYGPTRLRITIPEGFDRFDIAARLQKWGVCEREAFLTLPPSASVRALDPHATDDEGYLFPDTYWVRDDMSARRVSARLVENAERRLSRLRDEDAEAFERMRQQYGFGLREVVILASIVEKEARVASEQPIIAGVFLNRLHDPSFHPKRLQADPTVAYGCLRRPELVSCAGFDGKHVTRAMLADPDNPWNTYRLEGLPPTPIANPGLSALRAVLHPAQHDFFYFVARGDGRHTFSKDLASHNLAVQRSLSAAVAP